MISRAVRAAALFGCALLLGVSSASAASVRYFSDASEPFNRRVVAEIESVGFQVEQPESELSALPEDTVALVRVSTASPVVEVWLVDGKSLRLAATMKRDPALSDDQDSVRIAERVRGLLAPLAEKRKAAAGVLPVAPEPIPPPVPLPVPKPAAPEQPPAELTPASVDQPHDVRSNQWGPRDWEAAASLGVQSLPGGVGVSALLSLRRRIVGPVFGQLGAALPLTASTIERDGASADVDARLVFATLSYAWLESSRFGLHSGAGASLAWVEARGSARLPQLAQTDSTNAVLPHVTTDLTLKLNPRLGVGAGALLAYSPKKVDVAFGEDVVGSFGRPLVLGFVGISIQP